MVNDAKLELHSTIKAHHLKKTNFVSDQNISRQLLEIHLQLLRSHLVMSTLLG